MAAEYIKNLADYLGIPDDASQVYLGPDEPLILQFFEYCPSKFYDAVFKHLFDMTNQDILELFRSGPNILIKTQLESLTPDEVIVKEHEDLDSKARVQALIMSRREKYHDMIRRADPKYFRDHAAMFEKMKAVSVTVTDYDAGEGVIITAGDNVARVFNNDDIDELISQNSDADHMVEIINDNDPLETLADFLSENQNAAQLMQEEIWERLIQTDSMDVDDIIYNVYIEWDKQKFLSMASDTGSEASNKLLMLVSYLIFEQDMKTLAEIKEALVTHVGKSRRKNQSQADVETALAEIEDLDYTFYQFSVIFREAEIYGLGKDGKPNWNHAFNEVYSHDSSVLFKLQSVFEIIDSELDMSGFIDKYYFDFIIEYLMDTRIVDREIVSANEKYLLFWA